MELVHTVDWMRQISRQGREEGAIVGLAPTGGSLHAGRISLIEVARSQCSRVIVSIIPKPNLTDSRDDPSRFSRLLETDCAVLESLGVNYLFAPPVGEFYLPGFSTTIVVEDIANRLEGRANPGEFRAACAHILKLFEIIQPAFIYLERLQAQKACMLRRMVRDLNLDTAVVLCPIVREPDGLAFHSRNSFLKDNERQAATALYRALAAARDRVTQGERMADRLNEEIRKVLDSEPLVSVDYVEIVDADTFQPVPRLRGSCVAGLAAFIGSTRLIDNMQIEERGGAATCTI